MDDVKVEKESLRLQIRKLKETCQQNHKMQLVVNFSLTSCAAGLILHQSIHKGGEGYTRSNLIIACLVWN